MIVLLGFAGILTACFYQPVRFHFADKWTDRGIKDGLQQHGREVSMRKRIRACTYSGLWKAKGYWVGKTRVPAGR